MTLLSFVKYLLAVSFGVIIGYILCAILIKNRNDQWLFQIMNHYQGLFEDMKMDIKRKGEGFFVCLKCGQDIYIEDIGDVVSGSYVTGSDDEMRLGPDSTVVCKNCCED